MDDFKAGVKFVLCLRNVIIWEGDLGEWKRCRIIKSHEKVIILTQDCTQKVKNNEAVLLKN
ncbi:hypothetical protein COR53_07090 [Staphylococcus pettenkoferi]|nr:hypothetical protein COR53_07090 [Staphylococcus pettenkoferi]